MRKMIFNRISFKLGILFSGIFLIFLLLLGYMLYGVFSNLFIDYISQELLTRGANHSKALEEYYSQATLEHVILMEENVVTSVIITDPYNNILVYSDPVTNEMKRFIGRTNQISNNQILNRNWNNYQYIVSVSPIKDGDLGYVYMFYPTNVLKEMVFVLKFLIFVASIGIILIAVVLIALLSSIMTKPLLKMKEATLKMAKGEYIQKLNVKGDDEIAQLSKSIQTLGEQLQYFEDTRNDFLASISHELRTPLTYIKGYSDVLIKGLIMDRGEQQKYLKVINEETKRVIHLVNDLFEMSKIQTDHFLLNKELTDLTTLLGNVVQSLTPVAEKKGLKIIFNHVKNISPINLDPHRMEQVFYNVIENAIKYTNQGHVKINLLQDETTTKIIVEDTGIGIPEKDIPRIWDRFYRVEKSRARKTGGTGLGLYIVKEIVRLHDGEVYIESVECKGTKVTIMLRREDVIK
ncbi:two-component sensor histidine kinase [Vulcanibacillus modesticaldus]|uniref:histidine kinase n=1 Tax=Vulcanibacillus modesticaldus TaxID=337097 RepID=A0A1D2YUJ0_9BACI|nr:ATP-binding protein [Vulcanibacillus modesticaldus]OEF99331.1 two-component sensor histidine kinase [Vulcanibacillus modesticaldus]